MNMMGSDCCHAERTMRKASSRHLWARPAVAVQYAGHTGFGHYHERYVRQDGRWRIAKTKLTRLHSDNYPHEPLR